LLGVCIAAMLPTIFQSLDPSEFPAFPAFAMTFALAAGLAVFGMRKEWSASAPPKATGFGVVLRDAQARRLLLIAFVNAAPVAVSSTLFLFFVESRLEATGMEGPLLLLFFLAAAVAAPIWGLLAERWGVKPALLAAMVLSIAAFSGALGLGAGDTILFALVSLGSGAALGADMTLLPAIFAARLSRIAPAATEGFALWAFVSKFTLAFAAVALLPVLEMQGFKAGTENSASALWSLSLLYAGVPCMLKLVAIGLLVATRIEETE
jgi:GPH family glycoside/pentoside/hexuronide:cation symporter